MTSDFEEVREEAGADEDVPLSKESEREILEMVEDQLDRPNPPDTGVLFRRALHFIDRDVRHLSLQQFNAKFPLQVRRRRARDRAEERGTSDGAGGDETAEPRRPGGSTNRTQSRGRTVTVDRNPDVMEMVERELRENPDVSNEDLKPKAEEIDEEIEDLSARQFNARYPLQVKREMSSLKSKTRERGDGSRPPEETDDRREVVREALLDFAKAVAGADDRGDVIDVLIGVDGYVDRVVEKL